VARRLYTVGYDEKNQALSELAPPDDGNPLYTDYLKERHKPENAKLVAKGTPEQLDYVVAYLTQKESIKDQDKTLLEKENKIREWFTQGVGTIEWEGMDVKISWVEKLTIPKSILTKLS
jgi:hypothetical protein